MPRNRRDNTSETNLKPQDIEEDFLDVDKPLPGQNYYCISFVSPDKVIQQKELFMQNRASAMEIYSGDVDSVKKILKDKRPILMLYHMTLCPHCQVLKPTWEKVKRKLKSGNGLQVVEVEYSNMSEIGRAHV